MDAKDVAVGAPSPPSEVVSAKGQQETQPTHQEVPGDHPIVSPQNDLEVSSDDDDYFDDYYLVYGCRDNHPGAFRGRKTATVTQADGSSIKYKGRRRRRSTDSDSGSSSRSDTESESDESTSESDDSRRKRRRQSRHSKHRRKGRYRSRSRGRHRSRSRSTSRSKSRGRHRSRERRREERRRRKREHRARRKEGGSDRMSEESGSMLQERSASASNLEVRPQSIPAEVAETVGSGKKTIRSSTSETGDLAAQVATIAKQIKEDAPPTERERSKSESRVERGIRRSGRRHRRSDSTSSGTDSYTDSESTSSRSRSRSRSRERRRRRRRSGKRRTRRYSTKESGSLEEGNKNRKDEGGGEPGENQQSDASSGPTKEGGENQRAASSNRKVGRRESSDSSSSEGDSKTRRGTHRRSKSLDVTPSTRQKKQVTKRRDTFSLYQKRKKEEVAEEEPGRVLTKEEVAEVGEKQTPVVEGEEEPRERSESPDKKDRASSLPQEESTGKELRRVKSADSINSAQRFPVLQQVVGIKDLEAAAKDEAKEYSSEEEVEEQGKIVRRGTRSHTINRASVSTPVPKAGWLSKHGGQGHRFKNAKKRFFVLEYPFLRYYSKEVTGGDPENPLVQRYCKGSISLRGAVAIDQEMKCEKKHRKFTDTRFKLVGCSNNKEFILQAKDSRLKDEWIKAIQSNIEYANPGKKIGGVCYDAKDRYTADDLTYTLRIELGRLTLISPISPSQTIIWQHRFSQLKSVVIFPKDPKVITFDFAQYGGTRSLELINTTGAKVRDCIGELISTAMMLHRSEWKNTKAKKPKKKQSQK